MPEKISLSEHVFKTGVFLKELSNRIPGIINTYSILYKAKQMKKQRQWNPNGEESVITGEGEEYSDFGFGDGAIRI